MKKNCIIIPAYNEGKNIAAVIQNIKNCSEADIIVIDDGSKDHTALAAEGAGALVIRHPYNMGYGVALQTGYKYAVAHKYDVLVQIDGDGQHDPRSIPFFIAAVSHGDCDVLIGSRFLKASQYDAGLLKTMAIRFFRWMIRYLIKTNISDPTSGFQCMNRRVFSFFTEDSFPCDYPDANIIILLHRMGFTIKEMPVSMVKNPEGRSMHKGIFTIMYYFFKIFLSIFIILIREKSSFKLEGPSS